MFSLALSLVTGNVGGTTKKVIASAVIFVGVAVGNIVGPYAFIESGESTTLRLCVITESSQRRRPTRQVSSFA